MRSLTFVVLTFGLLSLGACCYPCHTHCAVRSADTPRISAESNVALPD